MGTLVGRDAERAAIGRLLDAAAAGAGAGLILRGEAGIGKSALLDDALARAGDALVLRTVGVEAESALAYAGLQRLVRPIADRLNGLPAPQSGALRVALGLAAGPPPDRFLVAVAVLTLFSDAAGERPLLCTVDDAHWVDTPTIEALAFVARRIGDEPVALLFAARDGEGRPPALDGIAELHLAGLTPAAAVELLAGSTWPAPAPGAAPVAAISPATRDEVVRAAGGNPLALIELPGGFTPGPPLPLSESLERAFSHRIARQPTPVRSLLLLAAAAGDGDLAVLRDAARSLDLDADLLDGAGVADLVRVDGTALSFRHPLIRSAAYQSAPRAQRQAAHRALAQALAGRELDTERRAWHRAQAADGPDEAVALALEDAADRTASRAGPAAAAGLLALAAELSPTEPDRSRRLAGAAEAAWRSGDTVRAGQLLDATDPAADLGVRVDVTRLRCLVELRAGIPADAAALAVPVLEEAAAKDPDRALPLMLIAGEAAFQAGQAQAVLAIRGLMERLGTPTQPRTALLARLLVQIGRPLGEHDQAAIRGLIDEVAALDDPDLLVRMGGVAGRRGDHATARRLWTQAAARARQLGAAGVLPWALLNLASDDLARGAFRFAEMHADEGRRLARETGQESLACHHDALLAELAAARGREPEVRALAAEILPETAARGLVHVSATVEGARAAAALVAGRPEEALDALTNLWTDALGTGRAEHALRFVPDLTEAAVRARHPERAGEPVAAYETWAEAVSSAPGRALAARNRALLAPAAEADGWYATALDRHRGVDRPLEQARTELLYGEYLRREKRRADARPHLRSALATFERLGADGWAERAAEELRATGETARRRDPSTLDTLTPRELQIARAVADGATNRDVAGQLFLSPRTVDYHLRKVFQKLGVNSRAELIRLMLAG